MEKVLDLWAAYGSTVVFAMVNAFFALSTYAVLSVGVLSFATVVFAAIGGFLAAQMVAHFQTPLFVAFPLAAIAGGLALVLITKVVALNAPLLTGGVNGLIVPAKASPLELAVLLGLATLIFYRLYHSWFGLISLAVREDPAVASTMGIPPRRIQFIAFVISGIVGGVGGAALAFTLQFISPETYFIGIAFSMIADFVSIGSSLRWLRSIPRRPSRARRFRIRLERLWWRGLAACH